MLLIQVSDRANPIESRPRVLLVPQVPGAGDLACRRRHERAKHAPNMVINAVRLHTRQVPVVAVTPRARPVYHAEIGRVGDEAGVRLQFRRRLRLAIMAALAPRVSSPCGGHLRIDGLDAFVTAKAALAAQHRLLFLGPYGAAPERHEQRHESNTQKHARPRLPHNRHFCNNHLEITNFCRVFLPHPTLSQSERAG